MNKNRFIDYFLMILAVILTPIFFISFSAFIPCFVRPFYYLLIDPLKIAETSGYDRSTIVNAYDDVMDFLWLGKPFKTGDLAFTSSEKAHFEDCKPLFHLQLILCIVSFVLLLVYFILVKTKVLKEKRILKLSPFSFGAIIGLLILIFIGVFALIDFDALFVIFHSIAFPGKSNWTFDPNTEQIINILPEELFFAALIFIVSLVILLSIITIVSDIVLIIKKNKRQKM